MPQRSKKGSKRLRSRKTNRRPPQASNVDRSRNRRQAGSPSSLADIPANLNFARRFWMVGLSVGTAARNAGIPKGRLRRLIKKYKLGYWDPKRRKWKYTDRRKREITIISEGAEKTITVRGFSPAQTGMAHRAAAKRFFGSTRTVELAPYVGVTITDTSGRKHLLETRPNVLLRLANAGGDAELRIYRLIE